jgi:hypothetical protein
MLELMNDLALELNESRRRELALAEMRAARASGGLRRSSALALVAAGQWLAGDPAAADVQPSPAPRMQVSGDCV